MSKFFSLCSKIFLLCLCLFFILQSLVILYLFFLGPVSERPWYGWIFFALFYGTTSVVAFWRILNEIVPIPYLLWKRRVRKIAPELCSICCICNKPIYPGQWVSQTVDNRLVHAGFHDTLEKEGAFCETGSIGIGFWDGKKITGKMPSLAEICRSTGKAVVRDIGPKGVSTRTLDH
jgi:hypothetical protein